MLALVLIALKRPYTFMVLGLVILILGTIAALKTPTDIFPAIGIPVVSVIWTYIGLAPDDMSGRVVYPYELALTTLVNDVEHIESQNFFGFGVTKIYFQPNVKIDLAVAQVSAASQTVLKNLPPGINPPQVMVYNASTVPVIQLALSSKTRTEVELNDTAQNFIRPQLTTIQGAAIPFPYGGKSARSGSTSIRRSCWLWGSSRRTSSTRSRDKISLSRSARKRSANSNIMS